MITLAEVDSLLSLHTLILTDFTDLKFETKEDENLFHKECVIFPFPNGRVIQNKSKDGKFLMKCPGNAVPLFIRDDLVCAVSRPLSNSLIKELINKA